MRLIGSAVSRPQFTNSYTIYFSIISQLALLLLRGSFTKFRRQGDMYVNAYYFRCKGSGQNNASPSNKPKYKINCKQDHSYKLINILDVPCFPPLILECKELAVVIIIISTLYTNCLWFEPRSYFIKMYIMIIRVSVAWEWLLSVTLSDVSTLRKLSLESSELWNVSWWYLSLWLLTWLV